MTQTDPGSVCDPGSIWKILTFLEMQLPPETMDNQPDSAIFSASNVFRQGAADASEAQTALKHVYSTFLRVSEPQYVPLMHVDTHAF